MVVMSASQASSMRNWADQVLFSEKRNTRRETGLMAGAGEGAILASTFGHVAFEMLLRSSNEDAKEACRYMSRSQKRQLG